MTYNIGDNLINDNGHELELIAHWDCEGEDFGKSVYICREPKQGKMRALTEKQLDEKMYRREQSKKPKDWTREEIMEKFDAWIDTLKGLEKDI